MFQELMWQWKIFWLNSHFKTRESWLWSRIQTRQKKMFLATKIDFERPGCCWLLLCCLNFGLGNSPTSFEKFGTKQPWPNSWDPTIKEEISVKLSTCFDWKKHMFVDTQFIFFSPFWHFLSENGCLDQILFSENKLAFIFIKWLMTLWKKSEHDVLSFKSLTAEL